MRLNLEGLGLGTGCAHLLSPSNDKGVHLLCGQFLPELALHSRGRTADPSGVGVDPTAQLHVLVGWPWACHLTSLCLSGLIFKMQIIKPPTSVVNAGVKVIPYILKKKKRYHRKVSVLSVASRGRFTKHQLESNPTPDTKPQR